LNAVSADIRRQRGSDAQLSPLVMAHRWSLREDQRRDPLPWRAVDHEGEVPQSYVTKKWTDNTTRRCSKGHCRTDCGIRGKRLISRFPRRELVARLEHTWNINAEKRASLVAPFGRRRFVRGAIQCFSTILPLAPAATAFCAAPI
jgi:hypothetical protein